MEGVRGLLRLGKVPAESPERYNTLTEYILNSHLLIPKGFTARDLQKMEALAPLVSLDEDLAIEGVPIHPMYAKPWWAKDEDSFLHLPKIPITEPGNGYWEVCAGSPTDENKLNIWTSGEKSTSLGGNASSFAHSIFDTHTCPHMPTHYHVSDKYLLYISTVPHTIGKLNPVEAILTF
jgi:hypothetical protein